jgi:hypothetical protein
MIIRIKCVFMVFIVLNHESDRLLRIFAVVPGLGRKSGRDVPDQSYSRNSAFVLPPDVPAPDEHPDATHCNERGRGGVSGAGFLLFPDECFRQFPEVIHCLPVIQEDVMDMAGIKTGVLVNKDITEPGKP